MSDIPLEPEELDPEDTEAPEGAEIDDEADEGNPDERDVDVDAEREEEERGDVAPEPKRETRYQRAIREAREAKEEARRLREDYERRPVPAAPSVDPETQRRAEEREREAVAMMAPDEVARYYAQKSEQRVGSYLAQMQDTQDRREFSRAAQQDRTMARLAPQVEQTIAALRARGDWSTDRETVFTYLYGKEMREKAREAATRQRQVGQRRIASQTTRPGNARGDLPRTARRPAADEDERLLRSITIGDL